MLTELGYKFTDENGKYCKHGISDLKRIVSVEEDINNELKEASFTIICDVTNPLHGKKGATYVYSKQKGLKDDEFEIVDNYVKNFSNIIKEKYSKDLSHIAGSGAAGGLGYAFLMFTNSNLKKGSNFMIDYLNLEKKISEVDILITGEGKLDRQSFMGKAPIELAKIAKKYNKKVIFLAGSIRDDEIDLLSHEEKTIIDASFSIQRGICTLEKAMIKENAAKNVERTMEQLCALLGFIYEKQNNILMGIFCIIMAGFGFSLMSLFVKLSGDLPSMQKGIFRNIIAAIISAIPLFKHRFNITTPKSKEEWAVLVGRSIFGTIGLVLNFYAITHISLADSSIIQKLSPFVILILSYIFFKEKMTNFQIGAVIVAFLGVMLVIKPSGSGLISTGALAALVGALFAGMAYTCVRYLGTHNISGEFIIFFFSLTSTLMLLPYLIFDYHVMTFYQLSMLILAGASASIGQYGITFAYRYAAAKNIAAFDYSQVVFSGILGFIVLGEIPDFQSFIGYVIVISVGIVLVLRSK